RGRAVEGAVVQVGVVGGTEILEFDHAIEVAHPGMAARYREDVAQRDLAGDRTPDLDRAARGQTVSTAQLVFVRMPEDDEVGFRLVWRTARPSQGRRVPGHAAIGLGPSQRQPPGDRREGCRRRLALLDYRAGEFQETPQNTLRH